MRRACQVGSTFRCRGRPETSTHPDDARPAFVTAVQEQLGLKLEPLRRPVEVLVVESIDRRTPD